MYRTFQNPKTPVVPDFFRLSKFSSPRIFRVLYAYFYPKISRTDKMAVPRTPSSAVWFGTAFYCFVDCRAVLVVLRVADRPCRFCGLTPTALVYCRPDLRKSLVFLNIPFRQNTDFRAFPPCSSLHSRKVQYKCICQVSTYRSTRRQVRLFSHTRRTHKFPTA